MAGFIGVHIGAGTHPDRFKKEYANLCKEACKKGSTALAEGRSALDAAVEAVTLLEDSPWCNAGVGSSLTWDGTVECDAAVMEGTTKLWGAAGAVPGVKNPCQLAREICVQQAVEGTLGRVPPCLLVGQGAREWARKHGVSTVDPSSLINERAMKKYQTYKRRVLDQEKLNGKCFDQLDTVGAVCIDGLGHTAAVCSSGGIALKESGRVGQAAVFGAGCWAEDWDPQNQLPGVASCTSGCGELLIRSSLARQLARSTRLSQAGSCHATTVHSAMKQDFLESSMLPDTLERLGGALLLVCSPEDGCGELMWTHSTNTLALGYMTVHSTPKSVISQLPQGQTPGQGLVVGGVTFKIAPTVNPG